MPIRNERFIGLAPDAQICSDVDSKTAFQVNSNTAACVRRACVLSPLKLMA